MQETKIVYFLFIELYEFFQNFLSTFNTAFSYFYQHEKIRLKNSEKILKKFLDFYEKKINNFCFLQFFGKLIVFE